MGKKKTKVKIDSWGKLILLIFIVVVIAIIENYQEQESRTYQTSYAQNKSAISFDLSSIPEYFGEPYVTINNNEPGFTEEELTTNPFEEYSQLDYLGRCGIAYANICKEIMPPEGDSRGDISMVKPTGWKQSKHNGEYLYNRCHLIGYQLSDEDANELNLITGTRYFNVTGMLPFENQVAEYVKRTNNHVLYRITPIYEGENLLASGIQMEAKSVEDNGEGVCFNVYVYNVQPGITIDYSTGASKQS